MGGLPRRATFLSNQRAKGLPDLTLDSGNIFADRPPSEASLESTLEKAQLLVRIMSQLGYEAAAVGEMELYLGLENLRALSEKASFRFLSANLTGPDGALLFDSHRVFRKGSLTVGVVGLTSAPSNQSLFEQRMGQSRVIDPVKAAADVVSGIRNRCDLVVVLSSLGYDQDLDLARAVNGIDIIIGAKNRRFMKKPVIEEGTMVTTGYFQGRAVGQITVTLQGDHRGWASREELAFIRRQIDTARERVRTPGDEERLARLLENQEKAQALTLYDADMVNLTPDFTGDPDVAGIISAYRQGLNAKQPGGTTGGGEEGPVRYIGAEKCRGCHEGRYRFWSRTPHRAALSTLALKDADADPDCVPCHVTGYERLTGYWPKAPRRDLEGVQCESCHGIGSLHAATPELHSLLHLPAAPQCIDCHTEEQDDDFDFLRDKVKVCAE
ncbi:MAG: multiheme c-type cytochrome [bacterium]|nr:multiheme c-type cytochrome [bacterium]MDT8395759.1 multiheme c-type cytochrome [bacterium]